MMVWCLCLQQERFSSSSALYIAMAQALSWQQVPLTLLPASPVDHGSGLQIERNSVYGPPCGFITALLLSQQRVHLGQAGPSALALFW